MKLEIFKASFNFTTLTMSSLTVTFCHDNSYSYLRANSPEITAACILTFSLRLTKQEFDIF